MIVSIKNAVFNIMKYIHQNYMGVQSTVFWIAAIMNIASEKFWFFAIPATIFAGMQTIIDLLKNK
jgi:hypothetical protein